MQELFNNLGYTFTNPDLLKTALTHKSRGAANNERMEFLGDSILNFQAAELIYTEFKGLTEGNMSRIRAALVREENLVKIAHRIGLEKHLIFVPNHFSPKAAPSMLADSLEAIFAAIYLDGGHVKVNEVIRKHLMISLQKGEATLTKDPKTALQEHLQGRGFPLASYHLTRELNQPNARFEVTCEIPQLNIKSIGRGQTRRMAETNAAALAMRACTNHAQSCQA